MKKQNKFDSIIFDLDGTLWDCSRAMAYAYNQVYKRFNIKKTVSNSLARHICSLPYSEYSEILLEGVPKELHATVLPLLAEHANASVTNFSDIALYDDIACELPRLADYYPIFIVSNCGTNYLNLFLELTSVGKFFKDSLCHGHNFKTKSENITTIVKKHNLKNPCYIGDSAGDKTSAELAQVPFFFAAYGACYNNSFSNTQGFNSFQQLVKFFLS